MKIMAKGNSMLPTLKEGEVYKLELCTNSDIKEGDIIVYYVGEILVCHRVIKIFHSKSDQVFFKTKGDNCAEADPYAITSNMVIGKIII